VARNVPEAAASARKPLAGLRGSAELRGSFAELTRDVRTLRAEGKAALTRRNARQRLA